MNPPVTKLLFRCSEDGCLEKLEIATMSLGGNMALFEMRLKASSWGLRLNPITGVHAVACSWHKPDAEISMAAVVKEAPPSGDLP
jgi:hypothetical protein